MRVLLCLILLLLTTKATCDNRKIVIAFEPFPPFITEGKEGLTVDMLRAIEQKSAFRFDVRLMTYSRAKHELKYGRIDIAGHTPKGLETATFYQYALELDWQIQTTSDLFSFDQQYLNIDHIKPKRIGTTAGNATFFAQQLGVEPDIFVEVRTLHQLVDMFIKGRIDVLLFERSSVMTLLAEKDIYGIHYQSIGLIPASIAVSKDEEGTELKKQLDEVIKTLDLDKIFSGYLQYIYLPSKGVTSKFQVNY